MPFHSKRAGLSTGAVSTLQQVQLSAASLGGARQKVCLSPLPEIDRSGAASQRSPEARTISSPSRAPAPAGGAPAATKAVPSILARSPSWLGAEAGKSSSAAQLERKGAQPGCLRRHQ